MIQTWHIYRSLLLRQALQLKQAPMAPPGTRLVAYQALDNKTSWSSVGINAWYYSWQESDHYCGMKLYVLETKLTKRQLPLRSFPTVLLTPNIIGATAHQTATPE